MNNYVADTMAIVLYLENRKYPAAVKSIFIEAEHGNGIIYISAVTLMEIGYLSEKERIDINISSVLKLIIGNENFKIHDLDSTTVIEAFKIKNIPELHDRLIAASASVLKATLITNDPLIRQSGYINTIW